MNKNQYKISNKKLKWIQISFYILQFKIVCFKIVILCLCHLKFFESLFKSGIKLSRFFTNNTTYLQKKSTSLFT